MISFRKFLEKLNLHEEKTSKLEKKEIKFVSDKKGSCDCSHKQLVSLLGAPEKVVWNFDCSNNKLTSLEGMPKKVGGFFDCHKNKIPKKEIVKYSKRYPDIMIISDHGYFRGGIQW